MGLNLVSSGTDDVLENISPSNYVVNLGSKSGKWVFLKNLNVAALSTQLQEQVLAMQPRAAILPPISESEKASDFSDMDSVGRSRPKNSISSILGSVHAASTFGFQPKPCLVPTRSCYSSKCMSDVEDLVTITLSCKRLP